ncbi:MAG: hypothetical protein E6X17_13675 [Sporomusaceae bacterium]|nr:hypothetical protein [Sporomusaceae bacterium]
MKQLQPQRRHPVLLTVISLVVGFTLAASYSYYTKSAASERANASITVAPGDLHRTAPLVLDPAIQGLPKRWTQPGKLLIRYTVKNESPKPLPVTVIAAKFPGQVILESGAATFETPTGRLSRLISPGRTLRLNASVELIQALPCRQPLGELRVIDANSGAVLGLTPVHLSNAVGHGTGDDTADAAHHRQQGGENE